MLPGHNFTIKKNSQDHIKLPEGKLFLEKTEESGLVVTATKKRWFIVFLFRYYACINGF